MTIVVPLHDLWSWHQKKSSIYSFLSLDWAILILLILSKPTAKVSCLVILSDRAKHDTKVLIYILERLKITLWLFSSMWAEHHRLNGRKRNVNCLWIIFHSAIINEFRRAASWRRWFFHSTVSWWMALAVKRVSFEAYVSSLAKLASQFRAQWTHLVSSYMIDEIFQSFFVITLVFCQSSSGFFEAPLPSFSSSFVDVFVSVIFKFGWSDRQKCIRVENVCLVFSFSRLIIFSVRKYLQPSRSCKKSSFLVWTIVIWSLISNENMFSKYFLNNSQF